MTEQDKVTAEELDLLIDAAALWNELMLPDEEEFDHTLAALIARLNAQDSAERIRNMTEQQEYETIKTRMLELHRKHGQAAVERAMETVALAWRPFLNFEAGFITAEEAFELLRDGYASWTKDAMNDLELEIEATEELNA